MTMWAVGDKAVAKQNALFGGGHFLSLLLCGGGNAIEKRKIYLVESVEIEDGDLFLGIGQKCGGCDREVMWPADLFEKLVGADTDIFKLADAPKPKVPELEDA